VNTVKDKAFLLLGTTLLCSYGFIDDGKFVDFSSSEQSISQEEEINIDDEIVLEEELFDLDFEDEVDSEDQLLSQWTPFGNTPELPPPNEGNQGFAPKRIDVGHIEGQGIGYPTGFTSLGLFASPFYAEGHVMPFTEMNGYVFNDGRFAGNLGLGGRYICKSRPMAVGFNGFTDYFNAPGGNFFDVSLGIEVISSFFNLSMNGYKSVGASSHGIKCTFNDYDGPYRAIVRKSTHSYNGGNIQLGAYLINVKNWSLFLGGGPYYFSSKTQSFFGGQVNLCPRFRDYVAVDLSVSHDPVFSTIFQAQIILSIPLYTFSSKSKGAASTGLWERQIYAPVQRVGVMPTNKNCCWKSNF
jgi:hypothetical protein